MNSIEKYKKIIEKYDNKDLYLRVEYPNKTFWNESTDDVIYKQQLINYFSDVDNEIIIYLHIPFCKKLCYYCKCVKEITHDYDKVKKYLKSLEAEILLFKNFMIENKLYPNVKEIYMGGGSPTYIQKKDFTHLVNILKQFIDISKLNRFYIEIDPRTVTQEKLEYYYNKGVTAISFGIQDFNPIVQKTINRVQSYIMIKKLMKIAQKLFTSINFDLIVGLPHQTPETIIETMKQVISLSPDRVSMDYYSSGDLKYYPHTGIINGLSPNCYDRHILFDIVVNKLEESGYIRTGAGYFSKPNDAVAKGIKNKEALFMQFGPLAQQYSGFIGFGRSASGNFGGKNGWKFMYQNYYEIELYEKSINDGKLPIYKDYISNDDNEVRCFIIGIIRTYFIINKHEIEEKYKLNFDKYFSKELDILKEFENDGLCKIAKDEIILTDMGKRFSEVIGSIFDKYSNSKKYKSIDIL